MIARSFFLCLLVLITSQLSANDAACGTSKSATPFHAVDAVLTQAVANGAFPGCTAIVGNSEKVLWCGAFGHLDNSQSTKVTRTTIYDLASLTKVVGTTSVAMRLFDQGAFKLNDPVSKYVPEFVETGTEDDRKLREQVTLRHLLTHTGGLPAWEPLYKSAQGYEQLLASAVAAPLKSPPGKQYRYSDLGMILMGEILSRIGQKPLAQLERELVFAPLGMTETMRRPSDQLKPRIAPTERIAGTNEYIRGVVHDENAQAGDGLTGHAGLFSTANDLARLAGELLRTQRTPNASKVFAHPTVTRFVSRQPIPGDARRGLGWQTFTSGYSGGTLLSEKAFGHTGFTGTSIWIDPGRDLYFILLTNRVHPTRTNRKISAVRTTFADAVVNAVTGDKQQ